MERLLDSLLSGTPGAAVVLKDREGREYESPARVISEADVLFGKHLLLRKGKRNYVVLTLK